MSEEKKKVRERFYAFGAAGFDGQTLIQAQRTLEDRFAGYPGHARLHYNYGEDCYDIEVDRDETDAEFHARTMVENNKASIAAATERRQLRELMNKYPDVVQSHTQKQS